MSWYFANYLSSTERSKYRDGQARSAVHRLADHRYRIRHCACSLAVILLRKLCHLSKTISLMYSIWQMTHLCDITYSPAKIGTSASMKACSLWNGIALHPIYPCHCITDMSFFTKYVADVCVRVDQVSYLWRLNKGLIKHANNKFSSLFYSLFYFFKPSVRSFYEDLRCRYFKYNLGNQPVTCVREK